MIAFDWVRPVEKIIAGLTLRRASVTRQLISSGSPFEKEAGYSRAVVCGDWCFVSGTTGYDYKTMAMPTSVEEQTRHCLSTIQRVLEDAKFDIEDIVRCRYYVNSAEAADRVFPIVGEFFKDIRPAATMIVCELIRPEMKIEIEATAFRAS